MKFNYVYFFNFNVQRIITWPCLVQAALKKLLKKRRSCLEALNSGLVICNFTLFNFLPRLKFLVSSFLIFFLILNRYEEVEVRKNLEEKERQEEKKRKEEITEKASGQSSPKVNKKDSKKVKSTFIPMRNNLLPLQMDACIVFSNGAIKHLIFVIKSTRLWDILFFTIHKYMCVLKWNVLNVALY